MKNVIYLSHGGGPLPILREDLHKNMYEYYKDYGRRVRPKNIVIISAHYESDEFKVIHDFDGLLYDYYGFPKESYEIEYNPPKNKKLGEKIISLMNSSGLNASESTRGLDHGVFIPLKIMYPDESIPVVQISLRKGLNEEEHIRLGEVLNQLDDVLIIGSGFSYHNLDAFFNKTQDIDMMNDAFHDALKKVILNDMEENKRREKLVNWRELPYANEIHPRHEHLLPLHVCYGASSGKAEVIFDDFVTGKRCICVEWKGE